MSDLDITLTVTRTHLGLPDLNLNDGDIYIMARQLQAGQMSWRKEAVTSPFVHGRFVVGEVMESQETGLVIYVQGDNTFQLNQHLRTLLDAFTEQYDYDLNFTVDNEQYRWRCERADYEVAYTPETVLQRFVPVALSFYRHPIQLAGPM